MTEQPVEDFTLLSAEQEAAILSTTELNANDRCDKCGAQAYVLSTVINYGGQLLFCSHHWDKVKDNTSLTIIRDDRSRLLARSEPAFTGV
jgi:hypothetical protein